MTTTASDGLLKKLELHRALKDGSPGFHLSDIDIDVIIGLLREDSKLEKVMTTAYGNLIVRHHQAARAGDEALRLRIYAAIELFSEMWPEEAKSWEDLFDPKTLVQHSRT